MNTPSTDIDLRITPLTIQAQVVEKLRDAILVGHFQPGQRLTEAALCRMVNVSRPSVREALRRLEGERLIVIVPNKGPHVATMTWEQAADIYEARALLEPEAAARFAARADREEVARMTLALEHFADANAGNDVIGRLRFTRDFYDVILDGCGNPIIAELLQGLLARISLMRSLSMSLPGRGVKSLAEMRRMRDAIASGDPEAARTASLSHIHKASKAAHETFSHMEQAAANAAPVKRARGTAERRT